MLWSMYLSSPLMIAKFVFFPNAIRYRINSTETKIQLIDLF